MISIDSLIGGIVHGFKENRRISDREQAIREMASILDGNDSSTRMSGRGKATAIAAGVLGSLIPAQAIAQTVVESGVDPWACIDQYGEDHHVLHIIAEFGYGVSLYELKTLALPTTALPDDVKDANLDGKLDREDIFPLGKELAEGVVGKEDFEELLNTIIPNYEDRIDTVISQIQNPSGVLNFSIDGVPHNQFVYMMTPEENGFNFERIYHTTQEGSIVVADANASSTRFAIYNDGWYAVDVSTEGDFSANINFTTPMNITEEELAVDTTTSTTEEDTTTTVTADNFTVDPDVTLDSIVDNVLRQDIKFFKYCRSKTWRYCLLDFL